MNRKRLTPIKPGGSIGKMVPCRKSFLFRFGVSRTRAPTLFRLAARTLGRPAKHLYGLNRAAQSPALQWNLDRLARAVIPASAGPQPGPETLCSSPTRFPFKMMTAVPPGRDSSFLRTCVWGGCAKLFCSFQSDVPGEVKRAGGACPATELAPPAVESPRTLDRWRPRPINAPESSRAQRRPAVLGHH